jgi:hypothetical protein
MSLFLMKEQLTQVPMSGNNARSSPKSHFPLKPWFWKPTAWAQTVALVTNVLGKLFSNLGCDNDYL